jgi:high-affinity Fe2+/Pb2+ permease
MTDYERIENRRQFNKSVAIGAASAGVILVSAPAFANTPASPIQQVTDTVTAVGAVTGVVTTIVLAAMGVRLAIKQVNRVATKG